MAGVVRLAAAGLAALVLTSVPAAAWAQELTGRINGTVKDANGGVLAGAVVRLTSPALLEGERKVTTDNKGEFGFFFLTPGVYKLEAELLPKFKSSTITDIRIGADVEVKPTMVLPLAGSTDSVTIKASAEPTRSTGIETRFSEEFIRAIPTRRNSMFSFLNNVPGVSPTSPSSGSINTVSIFGSAVNENAFLIDGSNFTCPCQGVSRAEPIVDVIQELHVQTMGASVEYGNMQGGLINVVTRQGGPKFAAQTSYYGQMSGLTGQPIVLPVANVPNVSTGYERERYRDFSASAGGPVWRDRLWFFGAAQYLRDYDSQPGTDPLLPRRYEQNKFFGKLNWRLTPTLHLMNSFHVEKWVNPQPPTVALPFITTQRVSATVPNMTFFSLTHVISNNTMWEARLSRFTLDQDTDPSSGDRETPGHTDTTGISSVNANMMSKLHLDRVTAKAVLHRYQSGLWGLDHQFRAGVAFERGLHRALGAFPGGVRFNDRNGQPFQAIYRDPFINGGVFETPAVFVSDNFTLKNRIIIDAGLRYDYSRAINPDLPAVSDDGNETAVMLEGKGVIYTNHVVSPRLGVNIRLDATGDTLLRANYGRFNQGVLTGELDPLSQGATPIVTKAFDPATGDYTTLVSTVDPIRNMKLDPDTRTPYTDELSVAFDRQIATGWRASAAYIWKHGRNYIAWEDRGGQYSDEKRTVIDERVAPTVTVEVPVKVLTNGTNNRQFFLTNPSSQFARYDAIVLATERRFSGRWAASGSYTYSRAYGLQVMSNGLAEDPQFSTIARPGFLTFGADPNDLTNARGRLPNDRPHVLRATTAVRLPWHDVQVAANLQHFSGKPWAETADVTLPQGSRKILLETRGSSHRLESQSLLDLRVSKTLRTGSAGTIDLMLDVLNVLNDSAAEGLVSDNISAKTAAGVSTFGLPKQYIDPRRAMLGVRFNFGG